MAEKNDSYLRRRKWLAGISLAVVLVLAALVTLFVWRWLASFSQEGFREYIRSFGAWGWAVLLGLQFLQVFVALIPGELLETAAGYAFGPWLGTILCYIGVAAASGAVFYLTKRFGIRLVELFTGREELRQLRFLREKKKRDTLVFLLFFLPGTPKDLLTYFIALTDMKPGAFLAITLIARLPSVLSSTVGGHMLGEENYIAAIVLYAVVGTLSLAGMIIYRSVLRHRNKGREAADN